MLPEFICIPYLKLFNSVPGLHHRGLSGIVENTFEIDAHIYVTGVNVRC